jgi:F-type H+-transporting ATPase subunit alpha
VIYAGTRGYLDPVAVADVGRYQSELLNRLHGDHADLLEKIRTRKTLSEELEAELRGVLDAFGKMFG